MEASSTVKLIQKVLVRNNQGLHTRPATVIVKLLQNCRCDVHFTYRKETINAKSILSILMLAAHQNSKITISVQGEEPNAKKIMQELVDVFERGFEELEE